MTVSPGSSSDSDAVMRQQASPASGPQSWRSRDGLRLAGELNGPIDGQLIVLLHGGGQTRHSWQGTTDRLVKLGYRVAAYDARGHGDSDWSDSGSYELEFFASDLLEIVEAIGAPTPVLVGASLGGDTSMVAAGELGLQVASVVLVDVLPNAEPSGVARVQGFMRSRPDGFETLEEMADAVARYQPHRKRTKNLETLTKNARQDANGRFRWHFDPKFAARELELDQRQLRLESALSAIDAPILLVRGMLSEVLTDDGVAAFQVLRPDAKCVSVPDAAHMVAGDQNDVFTDVVAEFLVRSRPAQGSS
jgi:pimeloyl-ACP methyl ester carboxylesterase